MKAILRSKKLWSVTEHEVVTVADPVVSDDEQILDEELERKKAIAYELILMSVTDEVVELIADYTDPARAWRMLREQFQSGDQALILSLTNQLNNIKMQEGGVMEEYLRRAREIRNRLINMGERITNRHMKQVILNGLPRSYDSTVQNLAQQDADMIFDVLSSKLNSEFCRRETRNQLHGDDEALSAAFKKQVNVSSNQIQQQQGHHRGRGRWHRGRGRYFQGRGNWHLNESNSQFTTGRSPTPGRGAPGRWTPQRGNGRGAFLCYNCGGPNHYARDCTLPPSTHAPEVYANSAEMFDDYYTYYDEYGNGPWYFDSGASGHIAADAQKLDAEPSSSGADHDVKTGGGESHPVRGTSSSTLCTTSGEIKLTNVRYVPSMKKNLISVGSIADSGRIVVFTASHCYVYDKYHPNQVIVNGIWDPLNGLYRLHDGIHANSVEMIDTAKLWHRRLGHLSYTGMKVLSSSDKVQGLPNLDCTQKVCECCLAGRQHRERFPRKSETRASKQGEKVHTDIIGPMPHMSLGGSRYALVFTDDFSRKSWIYFLRQKGETFDKFCLFKNMIQLETGNKLKSLRSDRGGEYLSQYFIDYCNQTGIQRELTQARTPQQNGVSERRNRTIMERARSLAADANLPTYLWSEAVATATYLVNRSPTRANSGIPPESKYSGTKSDLHHLKIFGCIAHVHVPKEDRNKLDSKTQRCLFVGYDSETKAYRLYDPRRRRVILSRDVVFDEEKVGFQFLDQAQTEEILTFPTDISNTGHASDHSGARQSSTEHTAGHNAAHTIHNYDTLDLHGAPPTDIDPDNQIAPHDHTHKSDHPMERTTSGHLPCHLDTLSPTQQASTPNLRTQGGLSFGLQTRESNRPQTVIPSDQILPPTTNNLLRRGTRDRQPSTRLADFWTLATETPIEPHTYAEACKHPEWSAAITRESNSILKNATWEVIDRPLNKKPITAKWLFKLKRSGDTHKFKARIVARGFQQRAGIDYHEVFAPVVRWSTIRTVLSLAAKHNWPIYQMDVITAFLNGNLKEEVLMEIPHGFPGANDPTKVCRLKKALYGLKQASKAWYDEVDAWMRAQGLTRSSHDPNLYYATINGKLIIILLYVDDVLLTGDNTIEIQRLRNAFCRDFDVTDLGLAALYLAAEITRFEDGIFLTQHNYIKQLLMKFNMQGCNPCRLPMDPNIQLQRYTNTPKVDAYLYRSLVGSLIYLTNTRPDVHYAVSTVSRYMDAPEETHLQAAKKILRYLQGTINHGLFMPANNPNSYHTYTDADWGRDIDTRKSTSGILHKIGNTSIAWSSKLQPTVSLSSTEAEYRVLTDAAKDIIYYRRLLTELGLDITQPTQIYSDNESCIKLAQNPVQHSRTKHIAIQQHFIREASQTGIVQVTHVPTTLQQADFLTKPLSYHKFISNRESARIYPLPTKP